ncbi:hypothetical protein EDC01DRAFT_632815 [Geopyxis carbonaria]|nr:hypothetical protein EDC01DRAFT_632815 [Geopyxis carbonaria]
MAYKKHGTFCNLRSRLSRTHSAARAAQDAAEREAVCNNFLQGGRDNPRPHEVAASDPDMDQQAESNPTPAASTLDLHEQAQIAAEKRLTAEGHCLSKLGMASERHGVPKPRPVSTAVQRAETPGLGSFDHRPDSGHAASVQSGQTGRSERSHEGQARIPRDGSVRRPQGPQTSSYPQPQHSQDMTRGPQPASVPYPMDQRYEDQTQYQQPNPQQQQYGPGMYPPTPSPQQLYPAHQPQQGHYPESAPVLEHPPPQTAQAYQPQAPSTRTSVYLPPPQAYPQQQTGLVGTATSVFIPRYQSYRPASPASLRVPQHGGPEAQRHASTRSAPQQQRHHYEQQYQQSSTADSTAPRPYHPPAPTRPAPTSLQPQTQPHPPPPRPQSYHPSTTTPRPQPILTSQIREQYRHPIERPASILAPQQETKPQPAVRAGGTADWWPNPATAGSIGRGASRGRRRAEGDGEARPRDG